MTRYLLAPLMLLLLLPLPSPAQPQPARDLPRYKVEMLFFRNTDPEAFYSEHWPLAEGLDAPAGERQGVPESFRLLPDSEYTLADAEKRLQASPRYQVLTHLVWIQPGLDKEHALPMPVSAGRDFSLEYPERMASRWETNEQGETVEIPGPTSLNELDGSVRLVLGRYLHLYTDLVLRQPVIVEQLDETTQQMGEQKSLFDVPIRSHRRMRSRELHYIDHPLLGILIQVTPVEEEAPPADHG